MTKYYLIRCTPEEIDKLEQNNVDYLLSDIMDMINDRENTEIEIEGEEEYNKAMKILNRKH